MIIKKPATISNKKIEQVKSLSGSIAHEMRNPLSAIQQCAQEVEEAINDNDLENKIYIKTNRLTPGNFYELNFNYELINKTKGEKILIVKNVPDIAETNYNLNEIKLIRVITTKTVKNLKRTYYRPRLSVYNWC